MKSKILIFTLLFCLIFSSFAFAMPTIDTFPENAFPVPEKPQGYKYVHEIFFKNQNGHPSINYIYSNEEFNIDSYITDEGDGIYFIVDKTVTADRHVFYNGVWEPKQTVTYSTTGNNGNLLRSLVSSTFDIRQSPNSEEIFFQAPPTELYQMIHKVTEEGLATRLTLGGTIRILVLCGVGLIALLMVLNLFGKVFNRFRS